MMDLFRLWWLTIECVSFLKVLKIHYINYHWEKLLPYAQVCTPLDITIIFYHKNALNVILMLLIILITFQ